MTLTSLPGLRVGHATDRVAATGCTVILAERGAVAACDVGGGASGTRSLDSCVSAHIVDRIHGLLLAGGSAFGLDAAGGVMRYLERRGIGFDAGKARVPIVPAAILYDLGIGKASRRPGPEMALRACRGASLRPAASGSVGAGTGATVGKMFGLERAVKGGIGNAGLALPPRAGGARVAVLAAVNAFGDVRDPDSGAILAGARLSAASASFAGSAGCLERGVTRRRFRSPNTTLLVVATDARLDRGSAARLARQCQDGLARCVSPAHTRFDGDLVFALSVGRRTADPDCLAALACRAIGMAVLDAIRSATSLGGVPAARDLTRLQKRR